MTSSYLVYRLHVGKATYVLGEMPLDDRPVLVIRWWPVGRFRCDPYRPVVDLASLHNKEVKSAGGSLSSGYFREPESGYGFWLIQEGQTEAVKVEERPIEPPKTKLPTRWAQGRWQKLHARRGWVDA